MDVAGIDLNLLVVLEALLAERSVTRAGKRVGLSQSALSSALGRLRDTLGDPLFVRTATGMVPTPRALELEPALAAAMAGVRRVLTPGSFDPATAKMSLRVATGDYGGIVLLPPLLDAIARTAPHAVLTVKPLAADPRRQLQDGSVDVIIAPFLRAGRGVEVDPLFEEGFVCVMRAGHPASGKRLTLTRYAALRHLLVSPEGEGPALVDHVLAERGLAREVAVRVPHFAVALPLVAASDLVATLPERLVAQWGVRGVVTVKPPMDLPTFPMFAGWHVRAAGDPSQAWFRQVVHGVAAVV